MNIAITGAAVITARLHSRSDLWQRVCHDRLLPAEAHTPEALSQLAQLNWPGSKRAYRPSASPCEAISSISIPPARVAPRPSRWPHGSWMRGCSIWCSWWAPNRRYLRC